MDSHHCPTCGAFHPPLRSTISKPKPKCALCDHLRSDHIDDVVDGEPVGCTNLSCYYEPESRHLFVEVEVGS